MGPRREGAEQKGGGVEGGEGAEKGVKVRREGVRKKDGVRKTKVAACLSLLVIIMILSSRRVTETPGRTSLELHTFSALGAIRPI